MNYYYYRYIFVNTQLKNNFDLKNYSTQITSALTAHYQSDIVLAEFSEDYYGFWLTRQNTPGDARAVGQAISKAVPNFTNFMNTYNYKYSNGTPGTSTQIFTEDSKYQKIAIKI